MIYVIRAKGTELVKIGFTHNQVTLRTRSKSIKTGCPHDLNIEATMPGSKLKERCIHGFCLKRHVRGEWFRLTKDEIQRMIEKYRNWTPSSAGIKTMPDVRHQIRGAKASLIDGWPTS